MTSPLCFRVKAASRTMWSYPINVAIDVALRNLPARSKTKGVHSAMVIWFPRKNTSQYGCHRLTNTIPPMA
ncbi:hypothetical protein BofuT4_uP096120.1 [Botrytis cinerea T4]|uniref:Uncharacterized protein n=1 Tax=Botryotinia fuckeliana (strain T4) TaxID=999810 RepID=G2YDQ6_BOTF4|nr:hypothetical protein BofuT4_uP096120.1 [Botrytis cinerea T4]